LMILEVFSNLWFYDSTIFPDSDLKELQREQGKAGVRRWYLSAVSSRQGDSAGRVPNHREHLFCHPTCLSTHTFHFLERVNAKIYEAASTTLGFPLVRTQMSSRPGPLSNGLWSAANHYQSRHPHRALGFPFLCYHFFFLLLLWSLTEL